MAGRPDQPEYPAATAEIDYVLESAPSDEITIEVLNEEGEVVRGFSTAPRTAETRAAFAGTTPLDKRSGLNRLAWDMRAAGAWDEDPRRNGRNGPHVPPGRYQVRLRVGNAVEMRPLAIVADPRLAADGITAAHLQEQYAFNRKLVDAISRARRLASALRQAQGSSAPQTPASKRTPADATRLRDLERRLVTASGAYPQPMLIDQLQNILRMTSRADQRIGRDAAARFDDLSAELAEIERAFASMRPSGSAR
jgi:hypothetical protein